MIANETVMEYRMRPKARCLLHKLLTLSISRRLLAERSTESRSRVDAYLDRFIPNGDWPEFLTSRGHFWSQIARGGLTGRCSHPCRQTKFCRKRVEVFAFFVFATQTFDVDPNLSALAS
jgi:hypothetical protein